MAKKSTAKAKEEEVVVEEKLTAPKPTAKEPVEEPVLRDELVYVKPNLRNAGWIKSPKHRAHFMVEGTAKTFMAPLQANGKIKNVLTNREKEVLEEVMQMEHNALSVYKKPEENFWASFKVRVTKDTLILNLADPVDYLKYKVLLAQERYVAPSIKDIRNKATYKFYIERPSELQELKSKEVDAQTRAWGLFGEVSGNKQKMLDFLRIYGEMNSSARSRVHGLNKDSSMDLVKGTLASVVSDNMDLFVNLMTDQRYETQLLLSKAVEAGLIERKNTNYHDKGESRPFAASFTKAVEFLDRPDNQDFRQLIETQVS